MAIPASLTLPSHGATEATASMSAIIGMKIQDRAAKAKTARTSFSPRDMAPILSSSSRMSVCAPSTFFTAGGKRRVSTNHAMSMKTAASGTPAIIHWPKPMLMSWLSAR